MVADLFPTLRNPRLASLLDDWFDGLNPQSGNGLRGTFTTPVAIWEADEKVHIEVDMPGVTSDSLDVTVQDGRLRIAAERKAPEEERKVYADHRRYGRFENLLALPEEIDAESIAAELYNGVLHLALSKKPQLQPKRIDVKVS